MQIVKWLNSFIWPIDWILTDTTTPGQSGPGSNDKERVLHISQSSRTWATPSDAVSCHTQDTSCSGLTPLQTLRQWPRRSGFNPRPSHTKDSKKWYLMLSCLTLSIIRYVSRVKWNSPVKGVAPFPTPWGSSYRKGSLRVTLNYGRQLYSLYSVSN